MGGNDPAAAQVPNPYRAAIVSAKQASVDPAETLRTAFAKGVAAMEAGAWIGGTSDEFFARMTGFRTDARTGATNSMHEFDQAIAGQPEKVDMNSWQVHWHNLGP